MTDNFEKDIDVLSKRLDRIDKMEVDLANYEQMERDIEKVIEPYQLNWELDCLSLPSAIQSILERKEQECEELKEERNEYFELMAIRTEVLAKIANKLGMNTGIIENKELFCKIDQLKAENERLKKEIRLYNCIDKWGTEQCHCACRCLGNEFCDTAEKKMKNIKQILAEIKEIAEEIDDECEYSCFASCAKKAKKQILNKISEVLDV